MKIFSRFNKELLLIIMFCLLVNIPYFSPKFMVGHDTKNIYIAFHYFFNHLVWYQEIPQWLPYGFYGSSALWYQISDFSPCTYLVGLCGWLAGARDTLFLFKLSAVADQMLFVLGLHLLANRLFDCRYTRLAVCLAGVGSVIWYWQMYWDLRMYYLIPLALYFYHRFLLERLAWGFWAALLTMLMSLVGGLAYWAPVYLFLFVVLNIFLLPTYWRSFSCLFKPDWKSGVLFIIFAICIVCYALIATTFMEGLYNYNPGRALNEFRTVLKSYLTYTRALWGDLHTFLDGLAPDVTIANDSSSYVGLLALAGAMIAAVRSKEEWFNGLWGSFVAITLLSGSGLFSWLMYWIFPGMSLFRHLLLLMEVGKILLLISAGYGISLIVKRLADREWLKNNFRLPHLLTLLAALMFIADIVVSENMHNAVWKSPMEPGSLFPYSNTVSFTLRLAGWGIFLILVYLSAHIDALKCRIKGKSILPALLVMMCVLDLWTFQHYYWNRRDLAGKGFKSGTLDIQPLPYFNTRKINFSTIPANRRNDIWQADAGNEFWPLHANVFDSDPCNLPIRTVDIFPKGVHELLLARNAENDYAEAGNLLFSTASHSLNTVLGCDANKLRIVQLPFFSKSDAELKFSISNSMKLESVVQLRGSAPASYQISGSDNFTPEYTVREFNANKVEFDVDLKAGQAGWLVYADAFNRYWRAYVNGREVPLYEAYLAFKALYVNEGKNRVVFKYENRRQQYAMNFLMFTGMIFAALCFWQFALCVVDKRRGGQNNP